MKGLDPFSPASHVPHLEEVRPLSPGSTKKDAVARWITVKDTLHLFNAITLRDRRSGAVLPQPLVQTLNSIGRMAGGNTKRPLPVDRLFQSVELCSQALPEILRNLQKRLVREHAYQPISRVREMDGVCMDWLGRLPGRTVREKVGGRTSVLGVSRYFSADTLENRVVARFARHMAERLAPFLEAAADKEVYHHGEGSDEYLEKMHKFFRVCTWGVSRSELATILPTITGEPNNVLLSDRNYSKVWRAWQWLLRQDDEIAHAWEAPQRCFMAALFWVTASRLSAMSGAVVTDDFCVISDGYGVPLGIRVPCSERGEVSWREDAEVRVLLPSQQPTKSCVVSLTQTGEELSLGLYRVSSPRGERIEEVARRNYRCHFNFCSDFTSGRGLPFTITHDADPTPLLSGCADLAGAALGAVTIIRDIFASEEPCPPPDRSEAADKVLRAPVSPVSMLGLDLRGAFPLAYGQEGAVALETLLWASRHRMPDEHGAQWLCGNSGRSVLPVAQHVDFVPLHDLLDDNCPLDAATLCNAARVIMESVAAEGILAPNAMIAYTVPDNSDDFSQKLLRSSITTSLGRSMPVRRSVAAALAWQEGLSEESNLSEGDVLVVIDGEGSALTTTFLVARADKRLKTELPETNGIYWERRPSPPAGTKERELSWRSLCAVYFRTLLEAAASNTHLDEIVSYLVDSGIGEKVLLTGEPAYLDMTVGGMPSILPVIKDETLWAQLLVRWRVQFQRFLEFWRDDGPVGDLIDNLGAAGRLHFLLVGAPFSLESAGWSAIFKETDKRFKPDKVFCFRADDGGVASGCHRFLQRNQKQLPAWKEWLPDLSLEVVKGGVFDELVILEATTVDPELGAALEILVPETLSLPAGQRSYRFPLITGKENQRPLAYDACLHSPKFPLKRSCEVTLTLRYLYGIETSYDLRIKPISDEIEAFPEIKVEWVHAQTERTNKVDQEAIPQFPVEVKGGNENSEESVNRLRDLAARFNRRCERVFNTAIHTALEKEITGLTKEVQDIAVHLRRVSRGPQASEAVAEFFSSPAAIWLGRISQWKGLPDWFAPTKFPALVDQTWAALCGPGRHTHSVIRRSILNKAEDVKRFKDMNPNLVFCLRCLSQGVFDTEVTHQLVRILEMARRGYFQNPGSYNKVMGTFAYCIWSSENFLSELVYAEQEAVELLLEAVERDLDSLSRRVAYSIGKTEIKLYNYTYPFQHACEILLGLLRLRGTEWGSNLTVGAPRMVGLAKKIKRIDCLFAKAGWNSALRSRIRFSTQKPQNLFNMSELAYVLNCYLTGEDGTNFIQLVDIADEP